jgi:hypothetical protein
MKIKRFENIVERIQHTKPKISQYIFDKYLSNFIPSSVINEYPYSNSIEINIHFKIKKYYINKNDLNLFLSIINSVEPLCMKDDASFKQNYGKGPSFTINARDIFLRLYVSLQKIEEIKSTKEYQEWLNSAELNYSKYKEEKILRKDAKKYNL